MQGCMDRESRLSRGIVPKRIVVNAQLHLASLFVPTSQPQDLLNGLVMINDSKNEKNSCNILEKTNNPFNMRIS